MLWQLDQPFKWGKHDCVRGFATRIVLALTGDVLENVAVGEYKTQIGALRAIRRAGYEDLPELFSSFLPPIHPAMAMVGDLGLIKTESSIGYAVCVFDTSAIAVLTETGYGWRAREDAIQAYRVGLLT